LLPFFSSFNAVAPTSMVKVLTKISTQESSQVNNYLIAQRVKIYELLIVDFFLFGAD
jgi:hypothetical protein